MKAFGSLEHIVRANYGTSPQQEGFDYNGQRNELTRQVERAIEEETGSEVRVYDPYFFLPEKEAEPPREGVIKRVGDAWRAEADRNEWSLAALEQWRRLAEEETVKRQQAEELLAETLRMAEWMRQRDYTIPAKEEPSYTVVEEGVNPPPLPVKRPMVDPVVYLKKETARGYNYTPEATEELYQTPVKLKQQGTGTEPGVYAGLYTRKIGPFGGDIVVKDIPDYQRYPGTASSSEENPQFTANDPEAELAHEFGHKWFYENLSDKERTDWFNKYTEDVLNEEPYTKATVRDYWPYVLKRALGSPLAEAEETYAHAAASYRQPDVSSGGWGYGTAGLQPEEYEPYFPGLYRTTDNPWNPPHGKFVSPNPARLGESG